MESGKEFEVYSDIGKRTNGEIYIGVVGPVRTGKSTFIKRFMDLCVLPNMSEEYEKKQTTDELPQSAKGTTITTTINGFCYCFSSCIACSCAII